MTDPRSIYLITNNSVLFLFMADIKLLEENTGKTLFDINHRKIFFDPPPRVMEIKTKINKLTFYLGRISDPSQYLTFGECC